MTVLEYIGPDPATVGGVPLYEGWPAATHEEPDAELAKAKLAFRFKAAKLPGWGNKPAYRKPANPEGEE